MIVRIQVCYVGAPSAGQPGLQFLKQLEVQAACTVHEAIRQSGVLEIDSEIDLSRCKVGIHGKIRPLDTVVREGDRIEIYRPLVVDPMAARRRRASVKG